jgi:KUP system potassium uptake protein
MQTPKVDKILRLINLKTDMHLDENEVSFFLGRDVILTDGPEPMALWRKKLFTFLARNSVPATAYFGIPAKRVIELGMQVRL